MTSKSIPREECLALAHRVSGGDRAYVDWVRIDPGDKTYDRYFDNLHALARGLARELVEAGHVVLASSGSYVLANPNDGRFQPLKKKLESDWLPQAQKLNLVEYLENLFVKERGAIKRDEIEQIGLALVAGVHGANDSSARASKGKSGRKPDFPPEHLGILKAEAFRLLDHHGGLNNSDPEFNSKEKLIKAVQEFAATKSKQFPKEPGRTTLQPHVDEWIEQWERGRP